MAGMPAPGDPAPDFTAPATRDGQVTLSKLRGRKVVLYFYPRDNTPGCTNEAKDFRDLYPAFQEAGAEVIGVSRDSLRSHERFAAKLELPFPLVSDADGTITEAWGVWQEKRNYGRTYMGIVRSTFLIDEEGRVARAWPKVRVKGHAQEVLEAVRET